MRLLTVPLTLASLPFKIAKAALSTAGRLISPEEEEEGTASVTEQPQPRFVRRPPPVHVSEEPELVAEAAEQGAEEGAGPEVHVDEPWQGYSRMNAADIKARLRSEPPTVAAAVSLFEASGKGRTSVLEAAARRTRG